MFKETVKTDRGNCSSEYSNKTVQYIVLKIIITNLINKKNNYDLQLKTLGNYSYTADIGLFLYFFNFLGQPSFILSFRRLFL